jgi:DNA-binding transcriptional LysR family regulator
MDLRRFDLNLLLVFDLLMRERSVSKAARGLFVSQSAMSHSLNRLREQLDDPLLVATKGGMLPTPRALSLEQPVREWLAMLEQGLSADSSFDPASSSQSFVLGSSDYMEYVFLPPLLQRLQSQAPGINIELRKIADADTAGALARGEVDACLQLFDVHPERGLLSKTIATEQPVVLMRSDHPAVNGHQLSLEQYLSLPHAVVDTLELSREVESLLSQRGLSRRVQLQVPNFLSAPIIIAETDLLATLPTYIARRFIHGGRLKIASLPLDLGYFPVNLCWHKVRDQDPSQRWLRQQFVAVAEQLIEQRKVLGR